MSDLSPDQRIVRARFGFDRPPTDDDAPELWDDVEGMTFGVRLALVAVLVAGVSFIGAVVVVLGVVLS